ncbi:MAG: RIP metalloprotease RseP [Pseudomonadota bacterium]
MFESPPFWMYAVGFILLLGPLVTVHELGHYLVGRWFGVKAEAFSVGFGKELLGRTDKHGTRWKLSALPLGGYVQFKGDMDPSSIPNPDAISQADAAAQEGSFHHAALWKRALIVAAGPVTNLVVAIAIFAAFFTIFGQPTIESDVDSRTIGEFSEESAARDAGLLVGDTIVEIDGEPIQDFDDIRNQIALYPNKSVVIEVERGGAEVEIPVTIASVEQTDAFGNAGTVGLIGVAPVAAEYVFKDVGVLQSIPLATEQCWEITKMMVTGIKQIITGDRSIKELGGPVKIAKISGEQLSLGLVSFVNFVALISLNLAFINFLPIPALDGGHLAFYAAEAVRKKPVGPRATEYAYRGGIAFVLIFMVVVTFNDLVSLPVLGPLFGS